jgi:hypothetical protein
MAFRIWNALPPETLPAQSAGPLFDGDEGLANARFVRDMVKSLK